MNSIGSANNSIRNKIGNNTSLSTGNTGSTWNRKNKTITIIFTCVIMALVIYFLVIIGRDYSNYNQNSPYLFQGTKIAKIAKNIPGSIVHRSTDGKFGLEATYSMWLFIEDSNFAGARSKEWKHVLHKGSANGMPLQSPGIWIYPNTNKLAININTYHSVKESCDVDNIPLNKWFHLTVSIINKSVDVYINCNLKKRCKLIGVPKMNYGDIYINNWQGFDGLISNVRYWSRAVSDFQLQEICKEGPSKAPCTDSGVNPPYLAKNYWMTTGFPDAMGFPKLNQ